MLSCMAYWAISIEMWLVPYQVATPIETPGELPT